MGKGEVGWYTPPNDENSTAMSGFGCKIPQWGHFTYLNCKWSEDSNNGTTITRQSSKRCDMSQHDLVSAQDMVDMVAL